LTPGQSGTDAQWLSGKHARAPINSGLDRAAWQRRPPSTKRHEGGNIHGPANPGARPARLVGCSGTGPGGPTPAERAACKADQAKYCADVKPGGGRVVDCLAGHKADLADGCRKVLESHGK